jgi:two-component system, NtrC family, sensor histidine kinase HydH
MKAAPTLAATPTTDPTEAMARFVAGFTHRIKSPLMGIKGYGEMMGQEEDRARRAYWCRQMMGGLDSLDKMIESIRRYQLPEKIQTLRLPLRNLVEEAWQLTGQLGLGTASNELILVNDVTADLMVSVDPFHFRNLLVNLLQNATDASPMSGRIRVASAGAGEILRVEDQGPGLGGLTVTEITRPFFTTRPDRAGLGLAVSRQIALLHGLQLDWQERESGGLSVRVVKNR